MIMAVAQLLKDKPKPTDADIDTPSPTSAGAALPASRADPRRGQRISREAIMNFVPKMIAATS